MNFEFGLKVAASAVVAAALVACGGGGGGGPYAANTTISGTVASGKGLSGASVTMLCANGTTLTGTTGSDGSYTSAPTTPLSYPCMGTAKAPSGTTYRGVLFSGSVVNFTPLTDMMVAAVLSSSGMTTTDQFVSKIRSDATYATNVSQPTQVQAYRTAVVNSLQSLGVDTTALNGVSFESAPFKADGTGVDGLLDKSAPVLQTSTGAVSANATTAATTAGKTVPNPSTGATGGAGT